MACEEAELGPDGFEHKMEAQRQLHEEVMSASFGENQTKCTCKFNVLIFKCALVQQLEMLKYMRKFPLDDQSAILKKVNRK